MGVQRVRSVWRVSGVWRVGWAWRVRGFGELGCWVVTDGVEG